MNKIIRLTKLENDRLWRLASDVALYAYSELDNFGEEEMYGMQQKLRDRAFDLTNDIAEAVGAVDPRDKTHYYGHALGAAYSVRNTLLMANKTEMLNVEPIVFVKLDQLTEALHGEVMETSDDIPEFLKKFTTQDSNQDKKS